MIKTLATALLALVFGFLGAALWSYSGLADNRTREFMLANPQILPEMVQAYENQEAGKRLADIRDDVVKPFPGAVMGNPNGTKMLVEFTDYNCSFCEASLEDVNRLIAEDPELKVVIREWPIFEGSDEAARMALAAGMQGKYQQFHEAMFQRGPANADSIEAAAIAVGLDMEKARADAASDAVSVELARNLALAQALGFTGTPGWVTGEQIIPGAVGYEGLKEAIENAGAEADYSDARANAGGREDAADS